MKRILAGLLSLTALIGLLVGLPAVLIALGPPRLLGVRFPDVLLRPDDGTLALAAIQLIGWVVWAVLAVAILLEVVAVVRRIPAPTMGVLGLPRQTVRGLVASATALFIGAATLAPSAMASPAPQQAVVAHHDAGGAGRRLAAAPTAGATTQATVAVAEPEGTTYVVRKGDSLWRIAERELGAGKRYPEIVRLNKTLLKGKPDFLRPGWRLTLPTPSPGDRPVAEDPVREPPMETGADPRPTTSTPSAPATTPAVPEASAPAVPDAVPADTQVVAESSSEPAPTTASEVVDTEDAEAAPFEASWLVAGLSGAGALLCGGLMLQWRRRRREQARHRRPGRMQPPSPPEVAPILKTMVANGAAVTAVETLDVALRTLAARMVVEATPLPAVSAVELGEDAVTLHLSTEAELPAPWRGDPDARQWTLSLAEVDATQPTSAEAPWPQLVAIGADLAGHTWLLNLEEAGVLQLSGDPTYVDDLVRYVVAELAVNPWSRDVRVDCLNTCAELVGLEPARVVHHTDGGVVAEVLADARSMAERLTAATSDVADARAAGVGDDLWSSRAVLVGATPADDAVLADLVNVVLTQVGRTGTSILAWGTAAGVGGDLGLPVHVGEDGRLLLPRTGLVLTPVGLTAGEARGCATLLASADGDVDDVAIPPASASSDEPWRQHCDEAGQLVDDRLLDRATPVWPQEASSVLPEDDDAYLAAAATTSEDLAELAPVVPPAVRAEVEADDPDLDADLREWRAGEGPRPRLTLLGPISARTGRGGHALAVPKRKPYFTELLAYVATHDGVTTGQVAEAMGITTDRVRKDLAVLREWLGVDPRTGERHLPPATQTRTGTVRGAGRYEVNGLLCDADLFRRLRVRGEARGEQGIDDLRAALTLVTGQPFDQLRTGGGTWLVDTALQQHFVCGIVDVAHLVTIVSLHRGDLTVARAAAELALLAAPYEEIPRLDLAAVAAAEGHRHEASRIVRTQVIDPVSDEAPTELSRRTEAILQRHAWLQTAKAS